MKVDKFDKNFKGCIEPMPGDIVELDGARLCLHTACNGATREDGLDIHYEEVKDEERV